MRFLHLFPWKAEGPQMNLSPTDLLIAGGIVAVILVVGLALWLVDRRQ